MSTSQEISNYFDDINTSFITNYRKNGLKKHCKFFLQYLKQQNLSNQTVLEIGCGIGGFLLEVLDLGAFKAIGIDLSDKMLATASQLAHEFGHQNNLTLIKGDFLTLNIENLHSDIIVADRVFCCYKNSWDLLAKIASLSPEYILVSIPKTTPGYKMFFAGRVYIRNILAGIKKNITHYYYKPSDITANLKHYGYHLEMQKSRLLWTVLMYRKTTNK